MKYIYRYWILVPLLLLAILSRNWVESPGVTPEEQTIDMTQSQADYYLETFETRKFNDSGEPQYQVNGDTLSHFPDGDRSVIVEPRLLMFEQNMQWEMRSPRGVFTPQPDTFVLQGDVFMLRKGPREEIRLQTRDVVVLTEELRVSTDKPITVIAENWQIESVGLESDIETGTLTLLSKVKARYETN